VRPSENVSAGRYAMRPAGLAVDGAGMGACLEGSASGRRDSHEHVHARITSAIKPAARADVRTGIPIRLLFGLEFGLSKRTVGRKGPMDEIRQAGRVSRLKYAIRNIASAAERVEAEGRRVLYLNIGDPLLYDFETPAELVDAVARAMRDGRNYYAPSAG